MLISVPIIHHRLLKSELRQWYFVDVGRPLFISFIITGFGRCLIPREMTQITQLIMIALLWSIVQIICAFSLPYIRQYALEKVHHIRGLSNIFTRG
jgi:hypothetical protein